MRPLFRRAPPPAAVRFAVLALGALCAGAAMAQSPLIAVSLSASPNPSTTGNYTVSGSLAGARPASFTSYRLREVGSSGPIGYYGISNPASFSFSLSGKAVGSYTYRAQRCSYTPGSSSPPRCENLGNALTVRVVAPNKAPVANAGADGSVAEGGSASLDGSGSSDADNDTLTYAWTQTSGTTVTLSGATAAKPSFTAPELLANQNLVFSLTVNDGKAASAADTVTVTVVADNDAPTANAGADRTVNAGASVTLSGSGSDPEKQTLSYAWSQTSGTSVTLSGSSTASASFTAPDSAATLTFSLTVGDGVKTSAADSVTVTVKPPPNTAPVANAGANKSVAEGGAVTLDGSASKDGDGDKLTYAWTQTSGTTVTLSGATAAKPSFTAPELLASQNLVFSLTVNDGKATSAADSVTVTVTADNDAPSANAGADRTVDAGASVTLSGSGSDPEKQSLTYAWTQTAGTTVSLSGSRAASASFTAPDSAGTLTFSLTVSDGVKTSAADAVTVTVRPPPNTAPVARAGADTSVGEGNRATLDGSGSRDDDGDSLTYAWTQTSGTTVTLSGATAAKPSFTAPELLANQNLVFSLTVNDGKATSAADSVTVTVTADNDAPTANAGADRAVNAGASVTLSGSGSDPEKQSLTYAWAQTSGTSVTLSGASTASASFTAPDSAATLTFSLTVGDGVKTSAADSVTVTVRPPADRTPSFGSAAIAAKSWTAGKPIAEFPAPAATGGDGALSYAARGLPGGVRLRIDSGTRVFSGAPASAGSGTATLAVRDSDGDIDTVSFAWTVAANATPSFGAASVPAQAWTAGKAIAPFTLPSATGGDAPVSHGAGGLPKGVVVSPELKVSGMPIRTGAGTATLTARDADGDIATLTFAWTVGSPNEPIAGTVLSASPASPAAVPDYTVSARHTPARSYHTVHLIETDPWGTVTEHHVGATSFGRVFRNRVNGSYRYRLRGCYAIPAPVTGGEVCEHLGDPLTVTVEVPDPDSMAAQLKHAYEARVSPSGDALRIERTSTARGGGQFTGVVLKVRQAESETEDAEPASVEPESASTDAGMPAWTVTSAVDLVINDVNLDGFADVLVRGLGKVGEKFSNVDDQILYAPGRAGGAPPVRRAVDDALKDFLTEVGEWTKNPSYFENKVETRPRHVQGFVLECWVDVASENLERYCRLVRRRVRDGNETVHTNKSEDAREFAGQFSWVDGRINSRVTPGSARAVTVDRLLSDVLGAPAMNGGLARSCPPGGSIEEVPCDERGLLGNLLFRAIQYIYVDVNAVPPNEDGSTDRNGNPTIQPGEYRFLTENEATILRENGFADLTDPDNPAESYPLYRTRIFHHGRTVDEPVEYKNNRLYVTRPHTTTIGMPECNARERRELLTCYTDEFKTVEEVTLLVHEATHVWQNEANMRTDIGRDEALYEGTYQYRLAGEGNAGVIEKKDFSCFTREQQAEMVSDLYRLRKNTNPRLQANNSHGRMTAERRKEAIGQLEAIVPVPLPMNYEIPENGTDPCASTGR